MDVERIPTVAEIRAWLDAGPAAVALAEKMAADADDARRALAGCYTSVPLGVYAHPDRLDLYVSLASGGTARDAALVKHALASAGVPGMDAYAVGEITHEQLLYRDWVKVAYSPALRRAGELLNFFPGKYPGGVPNSPGPLQSMLTSGLVGAGLGYGAGAAAEHLMPRNWERGKLRRTLAALGGVAGSLPGGVWGLSNLHDGRAFNDPSVLSPPAGSEPQMTPGDLSTLSAANASLPVKLGSGYAAAAKKLAGSTRDAWASAWPGKIGEALDAFGPNDPYRRRPGPLDVNVDAMGRTLWEVGAPPAVAGAAMGVLAAAGQMPGGAGHGWVTPYQVGQLAAHMGAGYLSGALAGSALGLLTGMPPETQEMLRRTGMYLGVVRAVLPKVLGTADGDD